MGGTNARSAVGGAGYRPGINVVELHRYRIYLRIFASTCASSPRTRTSPFGREVTRHSSRN